MRWKFIFNLTLIVLFNLILAAEFDEKLDDGFVEIDESESNIDINSEVGTGDVEDQSYESPQILDSDQIYFAEHFDKFDDFSTNWIKSKAKKDNVADEISKYDGAWEIEPYQNVLFKNDLGLILKSKAKHSAISSRLSRPFVFDDKPFIVQYEVTMQTGQECGGSYLKLLSANKNTEDLSQFNNESPYSIMFGPDKCGNDIKLHFIFRHVNPINGTITEKHCRKPKERLEEPFKDKKPHLYQLVLMPDNTFKIRVDHRVVNEGSLLNDFTPPVNPPREIDDSNDKKPENWDEREKIPDPTAKKPDDWDEDAPPQVPDITAIKPEGWLDDEPEMISDTNAMKPEDWDTDIDGEWEAPLIDNPLCEKAVGCGSWKAPLVANPEYKGKWRAPLIDNPQYQGKWVPRKIQNPDFFEDLHPFKINAISAVGIELWSMSNDVLFDNIIITSDINLADDWAAKTFDLKKKRLDKESKTLWYRMMRHMGFKPGWWMLYFIWVGIPIFLYFRYILRRSKEESFVTRLINYTNENPWLWAVYIVVIGTPLSFAIYSLCCSVSSKDKTGIDKKTDAQTPDDTSTLQDTICSDCQDEVKKEIPSNTSPKTKKSDLEVNEKEDNIEELNENDKKSENDDKSTEEEEEADEEIVQNSADNIDTFNKLPQEGARKRRPRKE